MTNHSSADKLQRRNEELLILNSIAQMLNSSVDLREILQRTLEEAAKLLGLTTGWIWLLDEESGSSYLAAKQSLPPVLNDKPRKMEGSCYCLDIYRVGDLDGAANVNVVGCSRLKGLVDGTDGLQYHATIPLYAQGKRLGLLNVASTDWRELSEDDLRLLYTVGDMLGIAIERARLFDKSARLGALEERNRLAREIHDTLAQGLTAVSLRLESADLLLEGNDEANKARHFVQQALSLTRSNLEEARRSVMDLRAAPLEGRTLVEALTELAGKAQTAVLFSEAGGKRPFPPRIEIGVYRIAQEALNNIDRHAQATEAKLTLTVTPEQLWLLMEDDGMGFDVDVVKNGRFGLIGLNERVNLLGGTLHVESSQGEGTRLEATIPL